MALAAQNGPYSLLLFQITHTGAPYGGKDSRVKKIAPPFFLNFHAFWTGLLTTAERFRGSLEQQWQQTRKSKYIQT